MAKQNNMLLYAGLLVGGYVLLARRNPPAATPALPTSLLPGASTAIQTANQATGMQTTVPGVLLVNGQYQLAGAPAQPSNYDGNYFASYVYPAMLKVNPNVGNANYSLSDAEAQQYMANYLDISQYANAPSTVKHFGSAIAAARKHWNTNGVAERRTFMNMNPKFNQPFVPAQPASGSGGGSFLSSALSVAGTILSILGPNDPKLTDGDVQAVVTGAAVIKQILPYYLKADRKTVMAAEARLDGILAQYT